MILELLLAVQLLETNEKVNTTTVAPTPPKKPAKQPTAGTTATLGGGALNLVGPRAPITIRPDQVAERYYRRPKGLN